MNNGKSVQSTAFLIPRDLEKEREMGRRENDGNRRSSGANELSKAET